jgi:hypothetical protein
VAVVVSSSSQLKKAIAAPDGARHHEGMEIEIKTGRGTDGEEELLNTRDLHCWLGCHRTNRLEEKGWRGWREGVERCRGKGDAVESIKWFRRVTTVFVLVTLLWLCMKQMEIYLPF